MQPDQGGAVLRGKIASTEDTASVKTFIESLQPVPGDGNEKVKLRRSVASSPFTLIVESEYEDGSAAEMVGLGAFSRGLYRPSVRPEVAKAIEELSSSYQLELEKVARSEYIAAQSERLAKHGLQPSSVVHQMLHSLFESLPEADLCVTCVDASELDDESTTYFGHFRLECQIPDESICLVSAHRHHYLPKLNIRKATLKDLIAIEPLYYKSWERGQSLARLPKEGQDLNRSYMLATLISEQDENMVFLVGESKGDIVGFVIATTRVNVKAYTEMYDLSMYDYFLPEGFDIESKTVDELIASDNFAVAEILSYVVDDGHASRAQDFVEAVFFAFPRVQYSIFSLPFGNVVHGLCNHFSQMPTFTEKAASRVMYVVHRDSYLLDLSAEVLTEDTLSKANVLVEEFSASEETLSRVKELVGGEGSTVLIRCGKVLIGAALVCDRVLYGEMIGSFELEDILDTRKILEGHTYSSSGKIESNGAIEAFFLNPVFSHRKSMIMNLVLDKMKISFLYFMPRPGKWVSEIAEDMRKIQPKRPSKDSLTQESHDLGATYSLFIESFTSLSYPPKPIRYLYRLVVVGLSTVSVSLLHDLVFNSKIELSHIYLIHNNRCCQEFAYSFMEKFLSNYQMKELSRMGLWQHVIVVNDRISRIDRGMKEISLESGDSIKYDKMVICEELKDELYEGLASQRKACVVGNPQPLPHQPRDEVEKVEEPDVEEQDDRPNVEGEKETTGDIEKEESCTPSDPNPESTEAEGNEEALSKDKDSTIVEEEIPDLSYPGLFCIYDISLETLQYITENESRGSVVVIGQTIEAVSVIDYLLKHKLSADRLVHIQHAYFSGDHTESLEKQENDSWLCRDAIISHRCTSAMSAQGIETVTEFVIDEAIFDSDAKVKGIRGRMNGRDITLDCHVIICANPRGVEDTLVRYLHEAAIVFNGRIIVDRNFQTNDECILAGGETVQFSKRYGTTPEQYYCDPRGLGALLAKCICSAFTASCSERESHHFVEPFKSKTVDGAFPGSYLAQSTSLPWIHEDNDEHAFHTVTSESEGQYVRVDVEIKTGDIVGTCYCAHDEEWSSSISEKLRKIVGLHKSYFGGDVTINSIATGDTTWPKVLLHNSLQALFNTEVRSKLEDIRRRAKALSAPDLYDAIESSLKECILANTDLASTYTIKSANPALPAN